MITNLINCPLFKGISIEELESLLQKITYQIKYFKKDEIIAFCDDEIVSQLIVVEGSVKGEMVDFTGKTIKIEDIEAPKLLAPAFLFGQNNKYPVTIIANNKVIIISIPKNAFVHLLQLNEIALKNFLNNISNRAQFLSNKIKFLSFQTIKGKIAHFILQRIKISNEVNIQLTVSQNQLAEMFGVARPSLARAMRELHNDGYIEATGKNIKILDKKRLTELLR